MTLPDAIRAEADARKAWLRARGTQYASRAHWAWAKAKAQLIETKRATDATAAHQPEVIGGPRND